MGIKEYFIKRKQQKDSNKIYNRTELAIYAKINKCDKDGKLYSYENICRTIDENKFYCFVGVKNENGSIVKNILDNKTYDIENVTDAQNHKFVCINGEKFEEVTFKVEREVRMGFFGNDCYIRVKLDNASNGNMLKEARLNQGNYVNNRSNELPHFLEFAEQSDECKTFTVAELKKMNAALNSSIHTTLNDLKIIIENQIRTKQKEEKDF